MGFFLPFAETVRRIRQIADLSEFLNWFDDYLLGALLLISGYLALRQRKNSKAWLIIAWSIATIALLLSLTGEFKYYKLNEADPGIFSTTFVAIAKGLIFLYMLTGLIMALKARRNK